MTGYVFGRGFEDWCNMVIDVKEGVYCDFEKAFKHLVELNKEQIDFYPLYEDGYGEDYFPESDEELCEAENNEDWDLVGKLIERHRIYDPLVATNLILKEYKEEPPHGYYSLKEIDIIK